MSSDQTLLLSELVEYLRLPPPTVEWLVERGLLPGQRVGGRWRFYRSEVDDWLDLGVLGWDTAAHAAVSCAEGPLPVTLANALRPRNVLLDLEAGDLGECFERAIGAFEFPEGTDRRAVLEAVRERERLCSTALDHGFAVPHTRRAAGRAVVENMLGFVRLRAPISLDGLPPVDLLFFLFVRDQVTHLSLLSRAVRFVWVPRVGGALRAAQGSEAVVRCIARAEARYLASAATRGRLRRGQGARRSGRE